MLDKVKDKVQKEAVKAIIKAGGRGIIVQATGVGKSKVPILYVKKLKYTKIALIVPTEELRDNNWSKEFNLWKAGNIYANVTRLCYASASKIKGEEYDIVILDEAHHLTPLSYTFFLNNKVKDIIALTATLPSDEIKKNLLKSLGLNPVYTTTLDEAQELDLVAPFKIVVLYTKIDNTTRYIKAGNKAKPFLITEKAQYDYLTRVLNQIKEAGNIDMDKYKMLLLRRMRLIYNFKSKTSAAKLVLSTLDAKDRTLVFCGSIEQANILCEHKYHSKTNRKDLEAFMEGKIDRLSCVNALNEGMNISNLDKAVIVQLNSKELNLIQRIGRIIRKRAGHEALIYILCCKDTQDEVWLQESLKNFNKENIEYRELIVKI